MPSPSSPPVTEPIRDSHTDDRPVVLIVDDHHIVTRALSRIIEQHGFAPVSFNSGQAALEYAAANPVSAVLLDIHMPDISGLIVSQQLRKLLKPDTPIIILSGDGSMETLNSLPHVGATHFYSKPIKAAQIVEHLRNLLL